MRRSLTANEADADQDAHTTEATAEHQSVLAAVDLGSNSFHLLVAHVSDGHLHVVDRLRESVRLADGLEEEKELNAQAVERALACLGRFGQRLRDMPRGSVRAVGTNALRSARDGEAFRRRAEEALGHPIEVIAGREEARLIYLGVAHALSSDEERRLVMDIGGGSTELIVGEGFSPLYRESLYVGCVSMSQGYFQGGLVDKARMRDAELAARVELEPIEARFRNADWQAAVGCSGTIKSVGAVVRAAGWSEDGITRNALRKLRRALIDAGDMAKVSLDELRDERRPVFPGGVAVLSAAFEALGIEHMAVSDRALREGLLYDLLGRIRHEDVRDRTVGALCDRYLVDAAQGARVEATALALLRQVAEAWELQDEENELMLSWAARLHELGIAISHSQYHKHGAYVLEHADMAGFSRQEQAMLASLVRGHRRKVPVAVFEVLPARSALQSCRLCILLRLAVLLHRNRADMGRPPIRIRARKNGLTVDVPRDWHEEHPLTIADLLDECDYLKAAEFKLRVECEE